MDAGLHERRMQMLGDYAEMALALAHDLHRTALNAESPEEKVRCAEAFHRLGRGLRQSLALHARLERDTEQGLREAPAEPPIPESTRRLRRKATLKAAVERLIWTERERLEDPPEALLSQLDRLLLTELRTEAFLATDPDLQIARLCAALRVPVPTSAHPRAGGDPSRASTPPAAEPRSSAWIPACAGTSGEGEGPPFHPSG
jgi:hypothetical protein